MSTKTSAEAVAAICGGLHGLVDVDVSILSDGDVREELRALVQARRQLDAQIAARVAAFDARNLAPTDGCRDVKAHLSAFARQSPRQTGAQLDTGRVLRVMPRLMAAAARGDAPSEHLQVVQALVREIGDAKAAILDEFLTLTVTSGTAKDVADACHEVRAWLTPDGSPPPDPRRDHEARYLSVQHRGRHVHLRGQLDLEAGAALITALDALQRPPTSEDDRTPGQRRADALADLVFGQLNAGTLPTVQGERPHLGILISPVALTDSPQPPPTLQQRADGFLAWLNHHNPTTANLPAPAQPVGGPVDGEHGATPAAPASDRAWLDWIGPVPTDLAQRIACDAEVWRIILDPASSQPLDVGRALRTAPTWMRKALHVRDRGCRWPGCTVPTRWTDAHHLDHWINGGHTKVERLLLLCRYHHRCVHEERWRIEFDPVTGEVEVWRPTGEPYKLNPTRSWTARPE